MVISDDDDKEEDFILSLKRKSSNISLKFKQPNLTGYPFKFISYFRKKKKTKKTKQKPWQQRKLLDAN